MKTALYLAGFLLLLCNNHVAIAQSPPYNITQPGLELSDVVDYLRSTVTAADTGEGSHQTKVAEFENFWTPRVAVNGSGGTSMFVDYHRAVAKAVLAKQSASCSGSNFMGEWKCIGPNQMAEQRMAYVETVWADPDDTSVNTVLAGTHGGLFKTTNGGTTWQCLTDNSVIPYATTHISSIAVHPGGKDTIYLGTSNTWNYTNRIAWAEDRRHGAGIIYTKDGGQTWSQEFIPKSHSLPKSSLC